MPTRFIEFYRGIVDRSTRPVKDRMISSGCDPSVVICADPSVARVQVLEQLQLSGARNGLGAAADAQLAVDVGGMCLDSAYGEDQLPRDFPV